MALCVLVACRQVKLASHSELDHEARISAVVAGLARPVAVAGRGADRLDLAERMEHHRVPGVMIAVVDGGRVAWERGYGVVAEGGGAVMPETRFQAASIAKPVVASAILRLVADGRLELDAPVNRWLRGWQVPDGEVAPASEVTVRRLLSHRAGFTNGSVGAYRPGEPLPTLLQALDGLPPSSEPPARIEYPPGERFVYSGAGYDVLQQLVVDLEGEAFASAMERLILGPAGMGRSSFAQPPTGPWVEAAARGHDGDGHPLDGGWRVLPEAAAGGLWTTAGDLARFLAALAASWSGEGLLPPELAGEMATPAGGDWGLGFEVGDDAGALRLEHSGSNPGYRAVAVLYPRRGQGAVVLTNGDGGDTLRGEVLRAIARAYGWPGYGVEEVSAVALEPAAIADLLGAYDYGGGYLTTLYRDGDTLLSRLGNGRPVEVVPVSVDELVSLQGTRYRLRHDEAGRVTGLVAHLAGGAALPAEKVAAEP